MAETLQIWNQALSILAVGTEVQSLTENSASANACRRMYEQARDRVLEDFAWPFATATVALALVEPNPSPDWRYSYRYPSDCVSAQAIASATYVTRNPGPAQIIPYRIGGDGEGSLIFCDLESASLVYTQRITEPARFSPSFADAVSFRLAFLIAPRVTGGDPSQLGLKAYRLYLENLSQAQANALNEEQPDQVPECEWIADR